MRRLGQYNTEHVSLRLPAEVIEAFKKMADPANPWRAIMRDALKQYLRKLGKLD